MLLNGLRACLNLLLPQKVFVGEDLPGSGSILHHPTIYTPLFLLDKIDDTLPITQSDGSTVLTQSEGVASLQVAYPYEAKTE